MYDNDGPFLALKCLYELQRTVDGTTAMLERFKNLSMFLGYLFIEGVQSLRPRRSHRRVR